MEAQCQPDKDSVHVCEHIAKEIRKIQYSQSDRAVPIPCSLIAYLLKSITLWDHLSFSIKKQAWVPVYEEDRVEYLLSTGAIATVSEEEDYHDY
jgi:hypothetical protein